jgi:hypothetical protein
MAQVITNNPGKIDRCICVSAFQDSLYGKQMRAFNGTRQGFRCTVCGKVGGK